MNVLMKRAEVELTLLGSMLMSEEAFYKCVSILKPEDFINSDNRELFALLKKRFEEGMSFEEVITLAASDQRLEQSAGLAVEYAVDNTKLVETLIKQLIEYSKKHKELNIAKALASGEITREEALAQLSDLERDRELRGGKVSDIAVRWLKKQEEQRQSNKVQGISTGSQELDAIFTYRKELTLICARPSIGKTMTALSLLYNQAQMGIKVQFFSLELTEDEVMARLISIHTGEPLKRIVYGWLNFDDVVSAAGEIGDLPIYIEPGPLTLPEIKAKIFEVKSDIVYIDYIQKVSPHASAPKQRKDFLDYVSAELLEIAKHTCPIVALAQLNRGARMGRDEPTIEHIKETGNFEQDASNILLLHRKLKENPNELLIKVAKCRVDTANREITVPFENGIPQFKRPDQIEVEFEEDYDYDFLEF
jgi:replicative DNA helicase